MRKLLNLLTCLFSVSIILQAQTTDSDSALQSMFETERAFARMSEEKGTRPSFMAFIAEDGILFRPKAVKGKQWMIDHPLPASDKRDLLRWEPSFGDMALAGDMGYTFGPWQYKSDIRDDRPVAWGHFVTVWQKQTDGSWKFAVDLGVSHPELTHANFVLQRSRNQQLPAKARAPKTERAALLSAERKFSEDSVKSGAQKAFLSNAAPNVHVFREGKPPFMGKALAEDAIPLGAGLWTWQPEAWDVSRSGDLGYSYGTYWLKNTDPSAKPETGNYFRIWKKQDGIWKVVVDLANPVPEKKL